MTVAALGAIVVLRHNTAEGGDVALALRELESLIGGPGAPLASRAELRRRGVPAAFAEAVELASADTVAVLFATPDVERVVRLLQRSAFAQEVFVLGRPARELARVVGRFPVPTVVRAGDDPCAVALSQSYVLESEGVLDAPAEGRLDRTIALLLAPYLGERSSSSLKLRKAKKTTLSLSHDLHIYKAKFFPRMVRALLNIYAPRDNALVLDPFCGSGTALLEGALLGHRCAGVDLDPICALISRAKVDPFLHSRRVVEKLAAFRNGVVRGRESDRPFPGELEAKIRRRDKIDGTAYLPEIAHQASVVAHAIAAVSGSSGAANLIKAIASDAVTKKVRYRFVGVGNGRYTIEIVKQPLLERLLEKLERCEQLCSVFPEIAAKFGGALGSVVVSRGDARDRATWPVRQDVDVILTSPPYLPASSGREHYAASRALSFFVLGMQAGKHGYYDDVAVAAEGLLPLDGLPEARRLMAYLGSDASEDADPQRDAMRFERKALPTHGYLSDIERFFDAAVRSMKADGVLLMVVAHQHVFYSHRRGEVEHIVNCRSLYSEIAAQVGLYLHEEIEMKLVKSAVSNARPMAKEDYFESVLVFRRGPPSPPLAARAKRSPRKAPRRGAELQQRFSFE